MNSSQIPILMVTNIVNIAFQSAEKSPSLFGFQQDDCGQEMAEPHILWKDVEEPQHGQ